MKVVRNVFAMLLCFCLTFSSVSAYAVTPQKAKTIDSKGNVSEIYVTKNSDGFTVTFRKNVDGTLEYVPQDQVNGIVDEEIVTFHVGLRNWTDNEAELYWEATSSFSGIKYLSCNFYVKSTSALYPATYYKGTTKRTFSGKYNRQSDYTVLRNKIPKDVDVVRVGFTSMRLSTVKNVYNDTNSEVVYK